MDDANRDAAADLAIQHAELASVLDGLTDDDWSRPTRCEGWDVADVVLHLAQTDEMAVASLEGNLPEVLAALTEGLAPTTSVDEGAAAMVERDRGVGHDAIRARWDAGVESLGAAIAVTDPATRVRWVAGELTARTLVTTRLAETWIHTGDVVGAVDAPTTPPDDRLWHIARLAWRTLPYAFAGDGRTLSGPVAFELTAPSGATWSLRAEEPVTVVSGPAIELCDVAARRIDPAETSLETVGPDGADVLRLVRTYA